MLVESPSLRTKLRLISPARILLQAILLLVILGAPCLLQGCLSEQAPFALQSKDETPPYVYEASCQVPYANEKDQRYFVTLLFAPRLVGGITGVDIAKSDGPISYPTTSFNDIESSGTGTGKLAANGMHWDFDHITSVMLDQFFLSQNFDLKPKSVLTVRIYTREKLAPVAVTLDIRRVPPVVFDF
jgi:hypothetical protein